ncbi:hypothetical protein DFP72DRAFT_1070686 [Ephemerocybe angulata]|uniref:Uncharacterized protein n=1 Tax=Ephemerocybe angulata TaxID=980116 RepID=A0A8H6M2F3_9AGAR|nr:hypothetical protein DFP72DRAFT_1070686 [Tulosesus angulatus]
MVGWNLELKKDDGCFPTWHCASTTRLYAAQHEAHIASIVLVSEEHDDIAKFKLYRNANVLHPRPHITDQHRHPEQSFTSATPSSFTTHLTTTLVPRMTPFLQTIHQQPRTRALSAGVAFRTHQPAPAPLHLHPGRLPHLVALLLKLPRAPAHPPLCRTALGLEFRCDEHGLPLNIAEREHSKMVPSLPKSATTGHGTALPQYAVKSQRGSHLLEGAKADKFSDGRETWAGVDAQHTGNACSEGWWELMRLVSTSLATLLRFLLIKPIGIIISILDIKPQFVKPVLPFHPHRLRPRLPKIVAVDINPTRLEFVIAHQWMPQVPHALVPPLRNPRLDLAFFANLFNTHTSTRGPTSAQTLTTHLTATLLPCITPFPHTIHQQQRRRALECAMSEEQDHAFALGTQPERDRLIPKALDAETARLQQQQEAKAWKLSGSVSGK